MPEPLKLKVIEAADLPLLSSLMQDAAIVASDIHYDVSQHQVIVMANRFCWEEKRPWWQRGLFAKKHPGNRSRCALHLNGVLAVQSRGLDAADTDQVLCLLDMALTKDGDHDWLTLTFATHMSFRIQVECIEIFLTDLGESFEAIARPDHDEKFEE